MTTESEVRIEMSSRKRGVLECANAQAAQRKRWIERNAAYYADDRRYMQYLVPPGHSVLDIGCSTGELLASLRPSYGVGVDLSPEMVRVARETNPGFRFIAGDAEDPDLLSGIGETFDYVIISDTIGVFDDIEIALNCLRPLCNERTRIIISYYSPLWEPMIRLATRLGMRMPQPEQNLLTRTDLTSVLALAGFETICTEQRQLVPVRLLGIGPFINRFIGPLPIIRRLCLRTYVVTRPVAVPEPEGLSVSIIVPCRNERGNIQRAISEMPQFGRQQEIIFVEGHSSDDTLAECHRVKEANADAWCIKVLQQDGKGKGDAVRKGFAAAGGDVLMILDADLTVAPASLPKFYNAIASRRGEFINGTRNVYPMETGAMRLLNAVANRMFAIAFSYLLNQRLTDTLCGTKVLRRADYERIVAARSYFGDFDPFGDFDLLFGASKQNLRIVEVPVHYKARTYGETQISRFRDGFMLLRMLLFALLKMKTV
jgi:SAM-dependent methyltransferase